MAEEKKGGDCERCEKLFQEIVGSFRIAVEKMKDLAANGKGMEYEAENNPIYNRYFGCALTCNTLLKEYFPERFESLKGEVAVEGEEKADAPASVN